MARRERTGITRSATAAAVAALALATPVAAYASTDADGTATGGSHRTQPVHDATILLPAPTEGTSTTTSWDVLPIATGAAGGILVVTIAFAAVTGVRHRRDEHAHMAHPV